MVKYQILKKFFEIEKDYGKTLQLNYIKWDSNLPKYDLRLWNKEGKPEKGFTLDEDELYELYDDLTLLLNKENKSESPHVARITGTKVKPKATLHKQQSSSPKLTYEVESFEGKYCIRCNVAPIWEGISDVYCAHCYYVVKNDKTKIPAGFRKKELTTRQTIDRNMEREAKQFGHKDENYVPSETALYNDYLKKHNKRPIFKD